MSKEIEDRRQRAREAAADACARQGGLTQDEATAVEIAVEAATRVQITPEAVNAFFATSGEAVTRVPYNEACARGLAAALTVLGFEVVM